MAAKAPPDSAVGREDDSPARQGQRSRATSGASSASTATLPLAGIGSLSTAAVTRTGSMCAGTATPPMARTGSMGSSRGVPVSGSKVFSVPTIPETPAASALQGNILGFWESLAAASVEI